MSQALATVVIVNFNGAHLLPACLDGLSRQKGRGPSFDTVVVDNASSDDSVQLLEQKYPWVRVIRSPSNLGFAGGNNLALREITTPYSVLLNNDAIPQGDWLKNLLEPLEADETIGATTGRVWFFPRISLSLSTPPFVPAGADSRELGVVLHTLEVDDIDSLDRDYASGVAYGVEGAGARRFRWTRPSGQMVVPLAPDDVDADGRLKRDLRFELSVSAPTVKTLELRHGDRAESYDVGPEASGVSFTVRAGSDVPNIVNNAGNIVLTDGRGGDRGFRQVDKGQFNEPVEVFAACGNGMAIRTEAARSLGYFDDDYFMYYEDLDLSWRMRAAGLGILYVPSATLRHAHAASSGEGSERFIFFVDRNRLLTLTKNAPVRIALSEISRYLTACLRLLLGLEVSRELAHAHQGLKVRAQALRIGRSYLRLAPRMLLRRRRIAAMSTRPHGDVERWMVPLP